MFRQSLKVIFINHTVLICTAWFLMSNAAGIMIAAYYAKMQGILIPVAMIAAYKTAQSAGGLLQPYMKKISFRSLSKFILFVEIIDLLAYNLLIIDVEWFIWAWMVIGIPTGIIHSAFGIKYDAYIGSLGRELFEEIQVMERVYFSLVGLGFGVIATGLYYLGDWYAISAAIAFTIMALSLAVYAYHTVWKEID